MLDGEGNFTATDQLLECGSSMATALPFPSSFRGSAAVTVDAISGVAVGAVGAVADVAAVVDVGKGTEYLVH